MAPGLRNELPIDDGTPLISQPVNVSIHGINLMNSTEDRTIITYGKVQSKRTSQAPVPHERRLFKTPLLLPNSHRGTKSISDLPKARGLLWGPALGGLRGPPPALRRWT